MVDDRTDTEKQKSPYFSHWEYTGNRLQKQFKAGPRKAVFSELTKKDILAATEAGGQGQVLIALDNGAGMTPEAAKAIRTTKWWLDFAEQRGEFASSGALLKKSAWAYRCTRIRAQAMASLPWRLVDKSGKPIKEHAIIDLLTNVNPEVNWSDLLDATESDLCTYATAFWLKIGNDNRVSMLQRLNPATMKVIANRDGIQGFEQQLSDKKWGRNEIIYFHNYNPENDIDGLPPLLVAKTAIEIEIAADLHLKDFFDNKAMPFHIFSMDTNDVNTLKRLRDEWDRQYRGSGKQHKTAFVGGGADVKEMAYAPEKLALEIVRLETRRQICAAYGCPPALVGAWEAANYGTLDIQRRSLYAETLEPEARYLSGVVNQELIWKIDPGVTFEFAFNELPIHQEDETQVAERYATLVNAGIIDPEVAAERLGFPAPKEKPQPVLPFENQEEETPKDELAKFKRKCLKNVKAGKPPLHGREFESKSIPPFLMEFVKGKLDTVCTVDEVNEVFDKAIVWGQYP